MDEVLSNIFCAVLVAVFMLTYNSHVNRPIENTQKFIEKAYEYCDSFNEKPLEYELSGKVYCSGGISFDLTIEGE